jgi:hypothetical protein
MDGRAMLMAVVMNAVSQAARKLTKRTCPGRTEAAAPGSSRANGRGPRAVFMLTV